MQPLCPLEIMFPCAGILKRQVKHCGLRNKSWKPVQSSQIVNGLLNTVCDMVWESEVSVKLDTVTNMGGLVCDLLGPHGRALDLPMSSLSFLTTWKCFGDQSWSTIWTALFVWLILPIPGSDFLVILRSQVTSIRRFYPQLIPLLSIVLQSVLMYN